MNTTLRDLYRFYTEIYRTERSEAVKKNYGYNMEKHILKHIGDREIGTITLSEVQILLNQMKGMSQTSIRSVYNDLKLIFRHAYIDEYISRDMAPYLTSPKGLKGEHRRALTPSERETVLHVGQTKRKYYAYLFMMLCGCRPSEAFSITKDDLDYEKETVHIRGTKTALSDRIIPCPRILLDLAENIVCGPVSVSETGLKVSKECQTRIWRSFFTDCHLYMGGKLYRNAPCEPFPFGKDLTAYNLRHEYCTNLARNGVDVRITQKLMGHSSPEMTLKVYTNLSSDDINTDDLKRIINNSAWGSLQNI